MDITINDSIEVTNKVVISFIPTHKLETGDISISGRINEEDLICSKWKRINSSKENLMKNSKFLEELNFIIPINNKLVVCSFKNNKNGVYYCLGSPLIYKDKTIEQ